MTSKKKTNERRRNSVSKIKKENTDGWFLCIIITVAVAVPLYTHTNTL